MKSNKPAPPKLKFGLNIKPPTSTKSTIGSMFTDTAEADDLSPPTDPRQPPHPGPLAKGAKSRASERLAAELALDSNVYAYDEVYDNIKTARDQIRQKKRADSTRPRYISGLLESAKRRQTEKEIARERIIEKERAREGDLYADKESFVTQGYKDLKDERRRLVDEDNEDNAARSSAGAVGGVMQFHRQILQSIDDNDMSKAMTSNLREGDSTGDKRSGSGDRSAPLIGSGLNVVPSRRSRERTGTTSDQLDGERDSNLLLAAQTLHRDRRRESKLDIGNDQQQSRPRGIPSASAGRAPATIRIVEQMAREKEGEDERKHAEQRAQVEMMFARRNDTSAIEAARIRYFERKREKRQLVK